MPLLPSKRRRRLSSLVVGVALLSVPAQAGAYSQPSALSDGHDYSAVCPPRPADPAGGADAATVAEVTVAQELADACVRSEQLQAFNDGQAGTRSDGLAGKLDTLHSDAAPLNGDLAQLHTDLSGTLTTQTASGAPASTVALSSTDAQTLTDGFGGLHEALWFLVGAVAAGVAGVALLRWWMP